ncbi:MAG: 2-phosphosulfolactate phosphatase [Pirellulales bacterium]
MPRNLHVHFLPALTTPDELADGVVVVIDVLRASTTIATALAAGATGVTACLEVEEARRRAEAFSRDEVRLGGERQCIKIAGFDLGNSPAEYTSEAVGGKTVLFTTTNGTRALLHCRLAAVVYVAGFVNAAATASAIKIRKQRDIHLLCAGTEGHISREDVLFAGCLVDRLAESELERNDSAELALAAWRACDQSNLAAELRVSRGGRNLLRNDMATDIALAARLDALDVVAEFEPESGTIRRM